MGALAFICFYEPTASIQRASLGGDRTDSKQTIYQGRALGRLQVKAVPVVKDKADDPIGVDWNGTTANERKRVRIETGRTYLYYSAKLFINSSLTMRGVFLIMNYENITIS